MEFNPAPDPIGELLGVEVLNAGDGKASVAITLGPHHCNGHGICHGGVTFLLGDTVMDLASNTGNPLSVAVHAEVDYVSPAHDGDRLIATGSVINHFGRTRVIDATVVNETTGKNVALFRGRTREIGK